MIMHQGRELECRRAVWGCESAFMLLMLYYVLNTAGVIMHQVRELQEPGKAYRTIMGMLERLASVGLVHCDLNEFNLLVRLRLCLLRRSQVKHLCSLMSSSTY
jgi:hypothetical protein